MKYQSPSFPCASISLSVSPSFSYSQIEHVLWILGYQMITLHWHNKAEPRVILSFWTYISTHTRYKNYTEEGKYINK